MTAIKPIAKSETELVSQITGLTLNQQDYNPTVKFVASLTSVLIGVITVDGKETKQEKQRILNHVYSFSLPDSTTRRLTKLIVEGIEKNKIYTSFTVIKTLTQTLSESEKLLLIAFGYDVSTADGDMDIREKKYLENIAKRLKINTVYLEVLEAAFSGKKNIDSDVLDRVIYLLDAARFYNLDAAFIKGTNDIILVLLDSKEQDYLDKQVTKSYQQLEKFQQACEQLDNYCSQLNQIVDECNKEDFIYDSLVEEIKKVSHKLQSQSFRIAVVGEFSQGKSTLLNALLGEEIQPVRAIPCSGTVTVLKYGTEKRVVCRYNDGSEEEIPFEQYQDKASISEEAALNGVSDELATSAIKEIVFEHPDLELCRHGVEIVDSPGLNEHPQRTSITQQLIEDTDAIIFLTNASRLLTQGERELIQDLRTQLKAGENEPAENLFMVVNFMDLLRGEKDKDSVRKRVERFINSDNPIITGENRIHFISAQAALDAMLDNREDEYLDAFNSFTQSIETFLTEEIGKIKLRTNVESLNGLIEKFYSQQQEHKQNVLENIGAISGWNVQLLQLADKLQEETISKSIYSWQKWAETLINLIYEDSEQWDYSGYDDPEQILQYHSEQLNQILTEELNQWIEERVKNEMLKPKLATLDAEIELIEENIKNLFDQTTFTQEQSQLFFQQQELDLNISNSSIDYEDEDEVGFALGIGAAGLVATGLLAFTGVGLIPIALTALGSGFGIGSFFGESEEEKIIKKEEHIISVVLDKGLDKFINSQQEIFDQVAEKIDKVFLQKTTLFDQKITSVISTLELKLQQIDNHILKSKELKQIHNKINKVAL